MEQDPGTENNNARLAKVFVNFHETRMLFIVFVIFRNVTPSWTKFHLYLKPQFFKIHFNIILHLDLNLLSGLPTNPLHAFLFFPVRTKCLPHIILLIIFGEEYKSLSSFSCVLLWLPRFYVQYSNHRVLKYSLLISVSQYDIRNFLPTRYQYNTTIVRL